LIVQLIKEQNKYDQMPSSMLDQLQGILPLADKVADEIVSEETDILDKLIPRMFEVMQEIAKFLCEYVKRGRFSRQSLFWISQMLMVAERIGDAAIYTKDKEMMEKMGEKLANVIKDFLSAVDVENLRLVRGIGKHTLSQYRVNPFSVAFCRAKAPAQASQTKRD
jgi:hypothetical protein